MEGEEVEEALTDKFARYLRKEWCKLTDEMDCVCRERGVVVSLPPRCVDVADVAVGLRVRCGGVVVDLRAGGVAAGFRSHACRVGVVDCFSGAFFVMSSCGWVGSGV